MIAQSRPEIEGSFTFEQTFAKYFTNLKGDEKDE